MERVDAFLQQEVLSASPSKLRLLLIEKAYGLSEVVSQLWNGDQPQLGDQWMLRIQEILSELLEGVTDRDHPAATAISDLYIFLIQLAAETAQGRDREGLTTIREILDIERETWRMRAAQDLHGQNQSPATDEASTLEGLDLVS